ncbi:MAG: Gfo/Idh/MocA family oxidoreductase [Betaproteobacteria bacterium]|nr:MAG: Gfo/Idh/MocA family oxidoreductase [Betaproteobacteria bacterium]
MNTARSPLRVGLVGAGWVTQHHLPGWQRLAGRAQVVAIADPSEPRARERAREFGIEQVYTDAATMFDRAKLDAVDIAAPREAHADLVRLAADRGLAVLCQKPLAPTLAEARALVADVATRTRLMVHENWRFRPYYRQISDWLRSARIGRVVQAQMTVLSSGLIPDADGKLPVIVRQPFIATLDRALVMEVLIHQIDTLRFLLGDMQVAHSQLGKTCRATVGEDRAFVTFDAVSGAAVGLLANLCTHGEPPLKPDTLVLVGEDGCIRLDGDTLRCHGPRPAEQHYDLAACYLDSYAATIAHFVGALASGSEFETAPADNLRTLKLVEDIYARAALD